MLALERAKTHTSRVRIAAIVTIVAALIHAGGATAKSGEHVLALVWKDKTATMRVLDAATLAPRGGSLPIVRTSPGPHAFSPDGTRLAFHTEKHGIRILAVPSLRVLRTVRPGIRTWGLQWQSARRLLVLEHGTALVVDPATGRIVARRDWDVNLLGWVPWQGGAVALSAPSEGIGPARLLLVGRGLAIRTVTLDRVSAGSDGGENNQGPWRVATPGLALDPQGGRAFVAGGSVVAAVDLRTLAVRYYAPARTTQKLAAGPQRVAAWLGGGVLAVSGADYSTEGNAERATPYGLRFVNVDTGETRMVDTRATGVVAAGGLALATGVAFGRQEATGLSAYDIGGAKVWQRFGSLRVNTPTVVGNRAYTAIGSLTWSVRDVETGRTTATRAGISLHVFG